MDRPVHHVQPADTPELKRGQVRFLTYKLMEELKDSPAEFKQRLLVRADRALGQQTTSRAITKWAKLAMEQILAFP